MANVEDAPSKRSERYELIALINDRVAAAAECKEQGGKMNDYMPILRQARDAYMELHNCEKDKAQEEISWKFHCANGDLQRKRENADRINKP